MESLRLLKVARTGAVKARAAALVTLGQVLVTAPAQLREQIDARSLPARAAQCGRLRPDLAHLAEPVQSAKYALRAAAREIAALDATIAELDAAIKPLIKAAAPGTLNVLGVGPQHAAQLLVTAGQNIDRLPTDAKFAHLCGASSIEASSGKHKRHRLNYGGDRAANSALHMVIVVRLRYCAATRAYLDRRIRADEEGSHPVSQERRNVPGRAAR